MELRDVVALRRSAFAETIGFTAGAIGVAIGEPALMFVSLGLLAGHFLKSASWAAFGQFHLPGLGLLTLTALSFGRPWWHGVTLALLLFSALDMPLNILILGSRVKTVVEKMRRTPVR